MGYTSSTELKINSLPLIGEYNNIWYPCINNYSLNIDESCFKIFANYNDSTFRNKEKDSSEKFLDFFNSCDKNSEDFLLIGKLLIQDDIFNNIDDIIDTLPEDIQTQLYKYINLKPISKDLKEKYQQSGGWKKFYKFCLKIKV